MVLSGTEVVYIKARLGESIYPQTLRCVYFIHIHSHYNDKFDISLIFIIHGISYIYIYIGLTDNISSIGCFRFVMVSHIGACPVYCVSDIYEGLVLCFRYL